MLAKQEREAAARGEGCLGKAADDEPMFVLRARDKFAPQVVAFWAQLVASQELMEMLLRAMPCEPFDGTLNKQRLDKIGEAVQLSAAMLEWQAEHGCKIPD